MISFMRVTDNGEGNVFDVILLNPDHIMCVTPYDKNPTVWSEVELVDDYTVVVVGTVEELQKIFNEQVQR
jgi:hypothetical protein